MQITYKRNGMKNYMIIRSEKDDTPGLREKMIVRNNIDHLARMTPQSIDGHLYYYYDIQGMVSLETLFASRSISESEISAVLNGISGLLSELQRYLLSPDEVLFAPSAVWLKPDTLAPMFIYVPGMDRDDRYSIHSLAEFLTEHVDESDRSAAAMAYRYLETVETGYIIPEYKAPDISDQVSQDPYHSSPDKDSDPIPPVDPDSYWDLKEGVSDEMKPFFEYTETDEKKDHRKKISYFLLGAVILAAAVYIAFVLDPSLFPVYLTDEEYLAAGAAIAIVFAIVLIVVVLICSKKNAADQKKSFDTDDCLPDTYSRSEDRIDIMEFEEHSPGTDDEKTVLLRSPVYSANRKSYPVLSYKDGRHIDITTFPFLIGKMKARVDGVIDGTGVSRIHAMIKEMDGKFYLSDLNSLNGTVINGSVLEANETVEIKDGDIISFADTSMTFHLQAV